MKDMSDFNFIKIQEILKGWSGDRKYCATSESGTKYLYRISPGAQIDIKTFEFGMMKRLVALGVPMCLPLEIGTCPEGIYLLQSWVNGTDAEDVITLYPKKKQYTYGLEAGMILKIIHSIPAPPQQKDWEERFNQKIDRNIKRYRDCPIHYENGDRFLEYLNANRHLLKNRPQCYQHGDYHIGNMMIEESRLVIIDFNRNDFGDPWEEFNRIVWCVQASPPFASGMVDGYFDSKPPMIFWKLLALYISSNTLSSLPWSMPFGQSEMDIMVQQAAQILDWYDNMRNPVPSWYR